MTDMKDILIGIVLVGVIVGGMFIFAQELTSDYGVVLENSSIADDFQKIDAVRDLTSDLEDRGQQEQSDTTVFEIYAKQSLAIGLLVWSSATIFANQIFTFTNRIVFADPLVGSAIAAIVSIMIIFVVVSFIRKYRG